MVLTAARPDRASFGCGEEDHYTFFDTCMLGEVPADARDFADLGAAVPGLRGAPREGRDQSAVGAAGGHRRGPAADPAALRLRRSRDQASDRAPAHPGDWRFRSIRQCGLDRPPAAVPARRNDPGVARRPSVHGKGPSADRRAIREFAALAPFRGSRAALAAAPDWPWPPTRPARFSRRLKRAGGSAAIATCRHVAAPPRQPCRRSPGPTRCAAVGGRADAARRTGGLRRRGGAPGHGRRPHRRRHRRRGAERPGGAEEGLWLRRPEPAGRSRRHPVPHRLDLQDLHLDRPDAGG